MNHTEFENLIDKYLLGTATLHERERLFEYYERMQTNADWCKELMGDKEEVKARIFGKIVNEIVKKESRTRLAIWKVAVAFAIAISTGVFGLNYYKSRLNDNAAVTYQTLSATNHILKVKLTDGTKVWLNNGSKLTYPQNFTGNVREVVLHGEAYFDVAHGKRPFIIRTGKMVTQVLGTRFNVQAFTDNYINKVTVVSGKVGVIVSGKQQKQVVFLTCNQEAAFNPQTNTINKATVADAASAISWIDHKIKFRNTPFPETMDELERIYNVHITFSQGLKTCLVFADFNRTDNASKVLSMLAKSLGGKIVQKQPSAFHLTGRLCK
jgi:transmembrane sensor